MSYEGDFPLADRVDDIAAVLHEDGVLCVQKYDEFVWTLQVTQVGDVVVTTELHLSLQDDGTIVVVHEKEPVAYTRNLDDILPIVRALGQISAKTYPLNPPLSGVEDSLVVNVQMALHAASIKYKDIPPLREHPDASCTLQVTELGLSPVAPFCVVVIDEKDGFFVVRNGDLKGRTSTVCGLVTLVYDYARFEPKNALSGMQLTMRKFFGEVGWQPRITERSNTEFEVSFKDKKYRKVVFYVGYHPECLAPYHEGLPCILISQLYRNPADTNGSRHTSVYIVSKNKDKDINTNDTAEYTVNFAPKVQEWILEAAKTILADHASAFVEDMRADIKDVASGVKEWLVPYLKRRFAVVECPDHFTIVLSKDDESRKITLHMSSRANPTTLSRFYIDIHCDGRKSQSVDAVIGSINKWLIKHIVARAVLGYLAELTLPH